MRNKTTKKEIVEIAVFKRSVRFFNFTKDGDDFRNKRKRQILGHLLPKDNLCHNTSISENMEVYFMISDKTKEDQWRGYLEECSQSGLPVKEWCRNKQLSTPQYYYWKKRIKELNSPFEAQIVELSPSKIHSNFSKTSPNSAIILHVQEYRIEVQPGFDPQTLGSLLKLLGAVC